MRFQTLAALLAASAPLLASAQSNGCMPGFTKGRDEVIFTLPYTYAQVMSIIGSFRNITWSGSPYDSVTLNGTDNAVGTARTYDIAGAHVIETITTYSKPPNGPYNEVHTLNLVTVPAANVSFYGDYDGTTVVQTCNGLASTMNFTINFCASNATVAATVLHGIHLTDAQTVGVFLGGQNFTSCAALGAGATPSSVPSTTGTTSNPATYTGAAANLVAGSGALAVAGLGAVVLLL